MRKKTIRRFSVIEIILHWSNAVLYLVLMATGGLILISRISEVEIASYQILSRVHRIIGIALIALLGIFFIFSILVPKFRLLWGTLRQSLKWGKPDIVWLIKVPFNMLSKRITLPAADRFNAGQKLHLLIIFTVLIGFSVSGLIMILLPGALAAWVIHLVCFIPAFLFLMLHLFLALLNPETRKALPAIFTGLVSIDYARNHHPLWTGDKKVTRHGSYVSLPVILFTAIMVVVVAIFAVKYYGTDRIKKDIHLLISQHSMNAITPGELTAGHANDPELKRCTSCHSFSSSLSSDKCLSCHKTIAERMTAISGYHGSLKGQCIECHSDHKGENVTIVSFDQTTFDHSLANFKLDGSHNYLTCNKCHNKKKQGVGSVRYIGLEFGKCISCHDSTERYMRGITAKATYKPDPHFGRTSCIKCHQTGEAKQKPIAYAAKCKQCHNAYYEDLFYDWSKSLSLINMQAESLLNSAQIKNDPDIDQLAERIEEIQKIGFHNIQLAHKLWNELVQECQ